MVRLIVFLNKWFRPPRVEGRDSAEAYSDWEHRWGTKLVRLYLEPAGDLKGKKVLDIGCGLGGKTLSYGEGGAVAVFGTDISVDNLEASVFFTAGSERPFHWAFFAGDATHLPVTGGIFDTTISNDTMEHFREPELALSEMVRVTKPGGMIWIFFTPYYSPLGSHLYDYIHIPWCNLLFTRRSLQRAISRIICSRRPNISPGELAGETDRVMNFFNNDLNRMSVRRFLKMVKRFPSVRLKYKEFKPAKFAFLKVLTSIPLLRELFTGSVICRLEKRSQ